MTSPCPLCGGTAYRDLPREAEIIRIPPPARLLRCTGCGLARRDPLSLPEEPAAHYDEDYYRRHDAVGSPVPESLRTALRRVEASAGPGRLLEIGCGAGSFLEHARQTGWEAAGLDASPWAVEFARTTTGLDVRLGSSENLPYPDESFRAVFAHHVIEHLPSPLAALRELFRVTEKGGWLVAVVPNEMDHLFFRIGSHFHGAEERGFLAELRRCLADHACPARFPSSHLFFFNPRTLPALARKAGWRIIWQRTWRDEVPRSRYPGAAHLKRLLYFVEEASGRAPLIEIGARKGP